MLLRSATVKAVYRKLMKLSPDSVKVGSKNVGENDRLAYSQLSYSVKFESGCVYWQSFAGDEHFQRMTSE